MINPITIKRSELLNEWIVIMASYAEELVDLGADKNTMVEIMTKCTNKARLVQKVALKGSFDKVLYPKIILSIARRYPENEDFRIITELENAYKYAHDLRPYVSSSIIEKVLDDLDNYCRTNRELSKIFKVIESKWLRGTTIPRIGLEKGKHGAPRQKLVRGLLFKVHVAFKRNIPTKAYPKIAGFVNAVFLKEIIKPEKAYERIKDRLNRMYKNADPPKKKKIDDYLEEVEWTNLWKDDIKKK